MTNIEVPISLIKEGNLDAIRELLPKENLFGSWATHPSLGRGIIISARLDPNGEVWFVHEKEGPFSGTDWDCIVPGDLALDPVELTSLEDFENAPLGTVVAEPQGNVYQKVYADQWEGLKDILGSEHIATSGPWKILRWGWGEQ